MKEAVRERKPTVLQQAGGVPGLIYASVPSVVFVVAEAVTGLRTATALAVGAGAGLALLRLLRKEPLQPAVSGLVGVAISAFIAYQSGDAKDYFLVGIWGSLVFAVVFIASVLVRWPLVGVIWGAMSGRGQAWRADRSARMGYDVATLEVSPS